MFVQGSDLVLMRVLNRVVFVGADGVTCGGGVGLRPSHPWTPLSVPCFREAGCAPGRTPPIGGTSRS